MGTIQTIDQTASPRPSKDVTFLYPLIFIIHHHPKPSPSLFGHFIFLLFLHQFLMRLMATSRISLVLHSHVGKSSSLLMLWSALAHTELSLGRLIGGRLNASPVLTTIPRQSHVIWLRRGARGPLSAEIEGAEAHT